MPRRIAAGLAVAAGLALGWAIPSLAASAESAIAPPPPPMTDASSASEPKTFQVASSDGHKFSVDDYDPGPIPRQADVLLVPDLGQTRKSVGRLAARLRDRGFHVVSMDNTGVLRNVKRGPKGIPVFMPM